MAFVKKSTVRNFFAIFIILLGIHQFTEFMLCTSSNPIAWATVGIINYSFLPAIALHGTLKFVGRKANLPVIYAVPIATAVIAVITPNFVTKAACNTIFV